MLLSWFQTRDEDYLMFQSDVCASHQRHRRANSTDPNPCQLQYLVGLRGKDVYSGLPNSFMNVFCCLCIQWFQGTSVFYFSLLWHGCAWQFLTCVMSCADTETERRDKGPFGSHKVTAKLQESMSMALGLTECIPKGFGALTVHNVSPSGSCSFQNITGSDRIRRRSCTVALCNHWASTYIFNTFFSATTEWMTQEIKSLALSFSVSVWG